MDEQDPVTGEPQPFGAGHPGPARVWRNQHLGRNLPDNLFFYFLIMLINHLILLILSLFFQIAGPSISAKSGCVR